MGGGGRGGEGDGTHDSVILVSLLGMPASLFFSQAIPSTPPSKTAISALGFILVSQCLILHPLTQKSLRDGWLPILLLCPAVILDREGAPCSKTPRFRDTWNSVTVTRLEEAQTGGGPGHAAKAASWRVSLGPFYLKPHLLPAHPGLRNSVCYVVAFWWM